MDGDRGSSSKGEEPSLRFVSLNAPRLFDGAARFNTEDKRKAIASLKSVIGLDDEAIGQVLIGMNTYNQEHPTRKSIYYMTPHQMGAMVTEGYAEAHGIPSNALQGRNERYLGLPIHHNAEHHWSFGLYDRETGDFYYRDSKKRDPAGTDIKTRHETHARGIWNQIAQLDGYTGERFFRSGVVREQTDDAACGLHLLAWAAGYQHRFHRPDSPIDIGRLRPFKPDTLIAYISDLQTTSHFDALSDISLDSQVRVQTSDDRRVDVKRRRDDAIKRFAGPGARVKGLPPDSAARFASGFGRVLVNMINDDPHDAKPVRDLLAMVGEGARDEGTQRRRNAARLRVTQTAQAKTTLTPGKAAAFATDVANIIRDPAGAQAVRELLDIVREGAHDKGAQTAQYQDEPIRTKVSVGLQGSPAPQVPSEIKDVGVSLPKQENERPLSSDFYLEDTDSETHFSKAARGAASRPDSAQRESPVEMVPKILSETLNPEVLAKLKQALSAVDPDDQLAISHYGRIINATKAEVDDPERREELLEPFVTTREGEVRRRNVARDHLAQVAAEVKGLKSDKAAVFAAKLAEILGDMIIDDPQAAGVVHELIEVVRKGTTIDGRGKNSESIRRDIAKGRIAHSAAESWGLSDEKAKEFAEDLELLIREKYRAADAVHVLTGGSGRWTEWVAPPQASQHPMPQAATGATERTDNPQSGAAAERSAIKKPSTRRIPEVKQQVRIDERKKSTQKSTRDRRTAKQTYLVEGKEVATWSDIPKDVRKTYTRNLSYRSNEFPFLGDRPRRAWELIKMKLSNMRNETEDWGIEEIKNSYLTATRKMKGPAVASEGRSQASDRRSALTRILLTPGDDKPPRTHVPVTRTLNPELAPLFERLPKDTDLVYLARFDSICYIYRKRTSGAMGPFKYRIDLSTNTSLARMLSHSTRFLETSEPKDRDAMDQAVRGGVGATIDRESGAIKLREPKVLLHPRRERTPSSTDQFHIMQGAQSPEIADPRSPQHTAPRERRDNAAGHKR